MRRLTILLLLFAFPAHGGTSFADGLLNLRFTAPRDRVFEISGPVTCAPPEGMVAVIGRLDYSGFSVETADNLRVLAPDGKEIPVTIEESSIYSEFDRIVSVRFFFVVPETDAKGDGMEGYRVSWGAAVKSPNLKVASIVPDPAKKDSYREFVFYAKAGGSDGSSVATIEVIADSNADYYFLLYLLPMALLFAILTVRKLRANAKHD